MPYALAHDTHVERILPDVVGSLTAPSTIHASAVHFQDGTSQSSSSALPSGGLPDHLLEYQNEGAIWVNDLSVNSVALNSDKAKLTADPDGAHPADIFLNGGATATGGRFQIHTKTVGDSNSTPKLTVNNAGAIGIGNSASVYDSVSFQFQGYAPSYGAHGAILQSRGWDEPPRWIPKGSAGQFLTVPSGANQDLIWTTPAGGGAGSPPEPFFSGPLNVNVPMIPSRKIPNQLNTPYGGASVDLTFYYLPSKINGNYIFNETTSGTSSGAKANYLDVTDPQALLRFPDVGVYKIHIQIQGDVLAMQSIYASVAEMTTSPAASPAGTGQILDLLYSSRKEVNTDLHKHDLDLDFIYNATEANKELYFIYRIDGGGFGGRIEAGPQPFGTYDLDARNAVNSRIHVYRMR
jgi:hypothetical protein